MNPRIELTPDAESTTVTPSSEVPKDSAFWPELNPTTAKVMRDMGRGQLVDVATAVHRDLCSAISKGWAVPKELRDRAVFEVSRVLMGAESPRDRLRAAETLERMVRANNAPNALPDQLRPGETGPGAAPSVQVNIQNNMVPPEHRTGPSVTVGELVDELLSRRDVLDAIDADLPPDDYGM